MPATRHALAAAALDLFVVVMFVAIGRRSHDESSALRGLATTAAPFLIGLALGWILTRAWRDPFGTRTGALLWPATVGVGMIARRVLFDDGTAASFVVVATIFLGTFLVGWRIVAGLVDRTRHVSPAR